jgi:Polyketide cyclase / dehydrase and lipid transport
MAHYNASVETPRPLDEVFAYLSDFSTTEEWDPGRRGGEACEWRGGRPGNRVSVGCVLVTGATGFTGSRLEHRSEATTLAIMMHDHGSR